MPGRRLSRPASLVGSGTATAFPTFVHSPGPNRRELTIEVAALNSATYGLPFCCRSSVVRARATCVRATVYWAPAEAGNTLRGVSRASLNTALREHDKPMLCRRLSRYTGNSICPTSARGSTPLLCFRTAFSDTRARPNTRIPYCHTLVPIPNVRNRVPTRGPSQLWRFSVTPRGDRTGTQPLLD